MFKGHKGTKKLKRNSKTKRYKFVRCLYRKNKLTKRPLPNNLFLLLAYKKNTT